MRNNAIKLTESQLKSIISESVKRILSEGHLDVADSGLADYLGTGSPESRNRLNKMSSKVNRMNASTHIPGNNIKNDSVWQHAKKSYGGYSSKRGGEILGPIYAFIEKYDKFSSKNEAIRELCHALKSICFNWERKYSGNYDNVDQESRKNIDITK